MKFYVRSGDMQEIVVANNPFEAAVKGVARKEYAQLGLIVTISERGFELHDDDDSDSFVFTPNALKAAGMEFTLDEDMLRREFPDIDPEVLKGMM